MPDHLQNELVRRAIDRDAQQTIEPRHEWTRDVYPQREDPFSSPDLLHQVMSLSGYVPGSDSMSIGEIGPMGAFNKVEPVVGTLQQMYKGLNTAGKSEGWMERLTDSPLLQTMLRKMTTHGPSKYLGATFDSLEHNPDKADYLIDEMFPVLFGK